MQQNIKITTEQIEKLRHYIPNIDECLKTMDVEEFLREVDDAEVGALDDNYDSTHESRAIRELYLEIEEQN